MQAQRTLCECGCGQPAPLARQTRNGLGQIKGRPVRFINGHNARLRPRKLRYVLADRGYETPCWIWQLCILRNGYGFASRYGYAHRLLYEEHRGLVPDGLVLDHLCRVRECVNPDHLEPVTQAENLRRGAGTKLTPADVRLIRESALSNAALARHYGMAASAISNVRHRITWGDVR